MSTMLGEIVTGDDEWTLRFIHLALEVGTWSKDKHRQVGAVLVAAGDRRKLSLGYNGFPHGVLDLAQRYSGPERLPLMVHAEQNVLDNACFPVEGSSLYTTKAPCVPCALRIINRRVARVYCPAPDGDKASEQEAALALCREAKLFITYVGITKE